MATPTLQEILLAVPMFGMNLNTYNELSPGLPSNEENLLTFLKFIEDQQDGYFYRTPEVYIRIYTGDHDYDADCIYVQIRGGLKDTNDNPNSCFAQRHMLFEATFDCNSDGLMKTITYCREIKHKIINGDICQTCHENVGDLKYKGSKKKILCSACGMNLLFTL